MPYLEKFSDDQKELLIALPYRAGIWVSESDQEGGSGASAEEMRALESIITGYAEDFLKSEFVEEVMRQTLRHKDKWGAWTNGLDSVPLECRRVVDILNERLDGRDALSFRQSIMDIATAVAAAYCESDEGDGAFGRAAVCVRYYLAVFKARIGGQVPPSREHVLNISQAERKILKELAGSLDLASDGNPVDSPSKAA